MWLLDTMVISEMRRQAPDTQVVSWLSSAPENSLYLSVVTISEIQRGIVRQRDKDSLFAERLRHWLDTLLKNYADRILPVTPEIACRWGELSAAAGHDGGDVIIAATALQHGLTVVTRNERHYKPFQVAILNPYKHRLPQQIPPGLKE
ncbi:MAG: type II toxin-antitoxin system VapC family toxin [Deltaproteobacteria bacterium]|nr:type II toxin-antitoxin system VapC family toxin [Deltaproteobacteria bacterium]